MSNFLKKCKIRLKLDKLQLVQFCPIQLVHKQKLIQEEHVPKLLN